MAIDLNKPLRWTMPAEDGSDTHRDTQRMLMKLQGNILKGHGRPEVTLIFFRIDPAKSHEARRALRDLANHQVTSAWRQLLDAKAFKETGKGGGPFVHLALAQSAYAAIGHSGLHSDALASKFFTKGMRAEPSLQTLADFDTTAWESAFTEQIDGVVLAADLDRAATDRLAGGLQARLIDGGCTIVKLQPGRELRNAADKGIEHFGYVDGRSQPLLLVEDIDAEASGSDGIANWDPTFPLATALVDDPGAKNSDSYGSYFVFRKLEQKVLDFKRGEQNIAEALGLAGEERELAGALLVGRFEDGTPVTQSDEARGASPVPNDFNYKADASASRCPFHAHIRKVNPRGSGNQESEVDERKHLFVRRGIPYHDVERKVHPSALPDALSIGEFEAAVAPLLPEKDVGLLFMAYNSQLANQFVFMQFAWANNALFPKGGTHGLDPVIGQGKLNPGDQKLPKEWDEPAIKPLDFGGFVTMKGGEYFFSPSLTFLKSL